jgi:hypothetical protein
MKKQMNPRVTKVVPNDDYTLTLTFKNGEVKKYDMKHLLNFGVFQELQDKNYFFKVRVFNGTITWPNEQDICPDTLYEQSTPVGDVA